MVNPGGSDGRESASNAGYVSLIPGSGRSSGEKMATHSSILVWRIPWTEEPGGLWSIGSQRVRHDWSDLAWIHIAVNSYNHKKAGLWRSERSRGDPSEKLNCAYSRGFLSWSQMDGWSWAGPSNTSHIEVRMGWVFVLLKDQSLEMGCSGSMPLGQTAHFWTSWRGIRLGVVRNQLSAVRHLRPNRGIWRHIAPSTREYVALALLCSNSGWWCNANI